MHYTRWSRHGDPEHRERARGDTALERLMFRVVLPDDPDGCWGWSGKITEYGYVRLRIGSKVRMGHVVSYEEHHGPIPPGMEVDHHCHNRDETCDGGDGCVHRRCCNPAHLRLVTPLENTWATKNSQARKTHCKRGHEFTPENIYVTSQGGRSCRQCILLRRRGEI